MEYLKNNFKKILVGIFVLVIAIEAGLGIWSLTKPVSPAPSSPTRQAESGGKILLLSAKKDYQVGETLPVTIGVTTGSKASIGTDVIIRYDPTILELTATSFEKGTFYNDYSKLIVDSKLGTLQVSGFTSAVGKPVLGTGVFGKLNFKVKQAGTSKLLVDFTPSASTDDSNIIESGTNKDILERVDNLEIKTVPK